MTDPGSEHPPVALSLGSNVGPSERHLRQALHALQTVVESLVVSSLYRTQPVSTPAGGPFLNTAVVGQTRLAAEELLAVLKALELEAGRRSGPRFGPRTLDIDLLMYGDCVRSAPELTIPHPRLLQRRFYLEPLAEIAPELSVPPDGVTVRQLLGALDDPHEVTRIPWSLPPV